ncbi:hypothetical protein JNM05_01920 [bacterium]|nr:hypothetical protein [bacterium]
MGLKRPRFIKNFKLIFLFGFLIFFTDSCSKKKTESEDTNQTEQATVIINEFPILAGRNLDSLKNGKYADRILAFSIELGHRSNDFNLRFAMMLRAGANADWKAAIKKVIESENYKSAEKFNLDYLDSLHALIVKPTSEYQEHFTALTNSYNRLRSNYSLIKNYSGFRNTPAILDSVLSNELVIKRSLRNFEEFMRTVINKKLPN